jgi:uncharacterized protein YfaS (alpha-2-macroglobulin family)
MPAYCLSPRLLWVLLLLIFAPALSNAQTPYTKVTARIDSLTRLGLPKSALAEVDKLDQLARKNNNTPQIIRAVIYRITFLSYLEEQALQPIINTLRADIQQSPFPAKPVLQSLLADMYWQYYQQNRYLFNQRTRLEKPDRDLSRWDLSTIINETSNLYRQSLSNASALQDTPVDVLNGVLAGNAGTRYLRPTLYDLLLHRALNFYLAEEPALPKPRLAFNLNDARLFGSSTNFAALNIATTDTASTYYRGLRYLQQITAFHLRKNNAEALADADLRRLQFLQSHSHLINKDTLYVQALLNIANTFSAKPISTDALNLLGSYYKSKDSLTTAHNYFSRSVAAYPGSLGGMNAAVLLKQIEEPVLTASVEQVNIPGKPLLAVIKYQNVKAANIWVYRLTQQQTERYQQLFTEAQQQRWQSELLPKEQPGKILSFLGALKPVQTQLLNLPGKADYRMHSAEFKMEALPAGSYVLLVKPVNNSNLSLTQLSSFAVSRLAYLTRAAPNGYTEFRVMDRNNGQPLKGVHALLEGRYYKYNTKLNKSEYADTVKRAATDGNGMFKTESMQAFTMKVRLSLAGDTLNNEASNVSSQDMDEEDEDAEDKTVLFTDRQIYRPGQTIYFKGLQLSTLKGKSKIVVSKEVEVEFSGANYKEIGKQKFTTNDFGTFGGTFIIPQNIMPGMLHIKTDDGELSVSVEEYKRPGFQVEFAGLKESYRVNDSVKVKGTVTAFAGYGLSRARVAYRVMRSDGLNYAMGTAIYGSRYVYQPPVEIALDTVNTDSQGNFTVKFKASPSDRHVDASQYRYDVTADVTDAAGETRAGTTTVVIGTHDVRLLTMVPGLQLTKDSVKIYADLTTLNNQRLNGNIKVEVYALQSPGRLFKKRLWNLPDQHLLTPAQFKAEFPDYAYAKEDEYAYWAQTGRVATANAASVADGTTMTVFSLEELRKQPSGIYKVLVQGRTANGDTASVTRYMYLMNNVVNPDHISNWVIPVLNSVQAGQSAEFVVGVSAGSYILAEHYRGSKVVKSEWLKGDEARSIKIPVNDADNNNTAVQYMMVYRNRLYTSYQPIDVQHPDKQLDIKLVTFRNKLQPGQKEQWKLQLSGYKNEKQAAEMVATLYDASLDNIRGSGGWQNALDLYRQQNRYYAWNEYNFINQQQSEAVYYNPRNYNIIPRNYEQLNLFGYSYYGGYNNGYHQYLRNVKSVANLNRTSDKKLEQQYAKNAALVKNGYDVSGRVTDELGTALPGVSIKVKGSTIITSTNSNGDFKVKVPQKAVLAFTYIGYYQQEIATTKAAKLAVTLKVNGAALNEVVVVGYGTQKRKEVTGSVSTITLRGMSSVSNQISGRVAGVQVAVTESNPLAADMLQSVRIDEPVGNAPLSIPPAIAIRKNFNETAFFYPQLRTDENGHIIIDFIIPESLTKWRFKAFAHTKNLASGYIQQDVITQKQLMTTANMPRFVREGDTINIAARLANLTAQTIAGKIQLQLFNALTMQPVALLAHNASPVHPFEVAAKTNMAVSYQLIIPVGLEALTYRLTAAGNQYSDGEENTLPVLPNRMLVTESMPMMVRAGQTKVFTFDKLLNPKSTTLVNKTLTLEYTQNPAWYAVQSLPYLMEFPYECSEQIFSRYYANSLSASIVNHNPQIKTVFERWKATDSKALLSNLEKNPELKATLLEETPWLRDAVGEAEQKKRIALLFDLNNLSNEQDQNLEKLQRKQMPEGGFPWFGGNQPDRYITQHVIAGIGQLYRLNIAGGDNVKLNNIRNNALRYLDAELLKDYRKALALSNYKLALIDATEIHAWYARSYYPAAAISADLKEAQQLYMDRAAKQWSKQNIYQQALIALTLQRYNRPEVAKAIIRSLMETAQQSNELGMYWANNRLGWYWYQSPIETQSLMIELFTEAGNQPKAVEEMKIWLLRNKQTNNWRTTKATAAACYALLMKGESMLSTTSTSAIKLNNQLLTQLRPDIQTEAGTGYFKTSWTGAEVKPGLGRVDVANSGKTVSWGALHWQYTEQLDKISSSNTDITLERKYFIEKPDNGGKVLIAVDAQHVPKTGDVLKVVVYLKAGRNYEYVQLRDMRPAGTEPVDVISNYKYQDGLYYYQVTKDVATNFFISWLNKGNYVFEYRLRVVQPGNYATGISSVQSMYAPEFNAHSEGRRMLIIK